MKLLLRARKGFVCLCVLLPLALKASLCLNDKNLSMIPIVIAHDEEGWGWLWLFHMPADGWWGCKACFSLSNRTKQLQPIDLQLASALGAHTPRMKGDVRPYQNKNKPILFSMFQIDVSVKSEMMQTLSVSVRFVWTIWECYLKYLRTMKIIIPPGNAFRMAMHLRWHLYFTKCSGKHTYFLTALGCLFSKSLHLQQFAEKD